ncbi:MAG: hydroxyacid dehydrogenase [Bacillota bacterium]
MKKVLIPQKIMEFGEQYLKERGYEVIRGSADDEDTISKEARDCEAILIRMAPITPKIIDAAPKLKVIARHGVGVDHIDINYAAQKGIWVVNAPTSNFNAVAEQVMLFILGCAKKSRAIDICFRERGANEAGKILGEEVYSKTLGILGLGRIGMQLAKKAYHGFEMRVIGYDPYIPKENLPEYIELKEDINDIFREADFVSIHMPLNNFTRGLVSEDKIKIMKPSAYLINTARGEIVDEKALISAIQNKVIAGGAFDVLNETPIQLTHPLLKHDNVIITPHTAAVTYEAMKKMGLYAAQGIDEVLSGKKPSWPVNNPVFR